MSYVAEKRNVRKKDVTSENFLLVYLHYIVFCKNLDDKKKLLQLNKVNLKLTTSKSYFIFWNFYKSFGNSLHEHSISGAFW